MILENSNLCVGCNACIDVCPQDCITQKEINGFLYPKVDLNRCISCFLCNQVCPIEKESFKPNKMRLVGYSRSEYIRKNGSSGGIFGTIADYVLNHGGVVYGAAFDENMNLRGERVDSANYVSKLYRSKYLQADYTGIYKSVLSELQNGRKVLFCATPCYCQALQNYIPGKLKDSLIVMDFACHGVAAPELFKKNRKWYEEHNKGKIEEYVFRYKKHKINASKVFYIQTTKNKYVATYLDDPYYYMYMKNLTYRPSCWDCKFSREDRCSDITVGDFHIPETHFPKEDRLRGFSTILINTENGEKVIESVKDMLVIEEGSWEETIKSNGALLEPSASIFSNKVYEDVMNCSYDELIKKYGFYSIDTRIRRMYYKAPRFVQCVLRKLILHR